MIEANEEGEFICDCGDVLNIPEEISQKPTPDVLK